MFAVRSLKQSVGRIGRASLSSVVVEAPAGSYLNVSEVTQRVLKVMKAIPPVPDTVSVDQYFVSDLGLDSGLRKDLNNGIVKEFCVIIPESDQERFISGASIIKYIAAHPKAR